MISVIIPCYNSSDTIVRALKSLEKQTFSDFEVIIVNDGSSDDIQLIVDEYKKNSKLNIILFSQDNSGVSTARNNGIRLSNGEYISFLDADDEYDPNFLEFMIEPFICKGVDFSVCRYKYDNETVVSSNSSNDVISKYDAINMFKDKRINKINMWSFVYKKRIIVDNSLVFSKDLKYGEDTEFVCKYLFHCDNGGVNINSQLYVYYVVSGSAMHKITYDRIQNIYAFQSIVRYWKLDNNWNAALGDYFISRAIWAVAKDFAMNDLALYEKLIDDFDVYKAMKYLSCNANEKVVQITAKLYCVDKKLFRFIVILYGILSRKYLRILR